jgi:hypothetical protein
MKKYLGVAMEMRVLANRFNIASMQHMKSHNSEIKEGSLIKNRTIKIVHFVS